MASRSELQRALWDRRAERAARFDHPPPPMTLQTLLKQPRPVLPAPVLPLLSFRALRVAAVAETDENIAGASVTPSGILTEQ